MKMNLAENFENFVNIGVIFQERAEDPRHIHHDKILRFVEKLLKTIIGLLIRLNFMTSLLQKKMAPGSDGIPYGIHKCAVS